MRLQFNRFAAGGAFVGSKKHAEGLQGVFVTGQGHGLVLIEGIEEGLELVLVGMVRNVSRICPTTYSLFVTSTPTPVLWQGSTPD